MVESRRVECLEYEQDIDLPAIFCTFPAILTFQNFSSRHFASHRPVRRRFVIRYPIGSVPVRRQSIQSFSMMDHGRPPPTDDRQLCRCRLSLSLSRELSLERCWVSTTLLILPLPSMMQILLNKKSRLLSQRYQCRTIW